jgi:hypothetical protein
MQSYRDIDPAQIKVEKAVFLKDKGCIVRLVQGNGKRITFQTPMMPLSWTPQVKVMPNSANTSLNLPLGFASNSSDDFKKWLTDLRAALTSILLANSTEWYGKALTEAQMADFFTAFVKAPPPDSSYCEVFLPKIAHTENEQGCYDVNIGVFNIKKQLVKDPFEVLKKGCKAIAVIDIPYVHVGKGTKIIALRCDVTQVIVSPSIDQKVFAIDVSKDADFEAMVREAEEEEKKNVSQKRPAETDLEQCDIDHSDLV